jgi:PAS domain S-box-containing protein
MKKNITDKSITDNPEIFKLVVNNSTNLVVITDSDDKILYVNKSAETITGFSKSAMMGKTPRDLWDNQMSETHYKFVNKKVKTNKKVYKAETTSRHKDGHDFQMAVSHIPLLKNKKLNHIVIIGRDITHDKEIEMAKTEFVSLASHQLRTPLSAVKWSAEMLLDGEAGDISKLQKKYIKQIYHGNEMMVELVNALLNVSRIELGTFVIEPEPTDLYSLGKNVIQDVRPRVTEKKQKIVFKCSKTLKIKADENLIRIIIQNLLTNAVKYTKETGTIKLTIEKTASKFQISVADNGYGIPADQKDKIFTKLFRADNIKAKDEGTGLGLYIVRKIINEAGGKISFKSQENKGTTFLVSFPLSGMKKKKGMKDLISEGLLR